MGKRLHPCHAIVLAATVLALSACDDSGEPSRSNGRAPRDGSQLSDELKEGKRQFETTCARCHGADGAGGPLPRTDLRGLFGRRDESAVREVIITGRGLMPPNPRFGKPAGRAELDSTLAYLRWLLETR